MWSLIHGRGVRTAVDLSFAARALVNRAENVHELNHQLSL